MVHIRKASQREEIDEFRKEVRMLGNTVSLTFVYEGNHLTVYSCS
jgi:hypothetical protein